MAIKERDRVYRWITHQGDFRISLVQSRKLANQAIQRHQLKGASALLLTDALSVTLLTASLLKTDQQVSLKINHPRHGELLATEASRSGEVRGYVNTDRFASNSPDLLQIIKENLLGSVLQISWWHERKPRHSFVPVEHGDLAADLNGYFLQSEQIPCFILHDTAINSESQVEKSWSLLIQALPGSPEQALQKMANILRYQKATDIINEHLPNLCCQPERFAHELLPDFPLRELDRYPVDFYCRCSKESFARSLRILGEDELEDMAQEGTQEIVCHFCNQSWFYCPDDLRALGPS